MVNRVALTNWGQTTVIITRREIVRVETSGARAALNRRLTASTITHRKLVGVAKTMTIWGQMHRKLHPRSRTKERQKPSCQRSMNDQGAKSKNHDVTWPTQQLMSL